MPPGRSVYEAASAVEPFQVLTAEHALIRLHLNRALEAARRAPGGPEARRTLVVLLDGVQVHQRREDRVMYPLCERLFGGKDGAASVLRDEHAAIRRAFDALLPGATRPGPVSAADLEDLRRLLEAHFVREERVLFPLMAAHLEGREAADLARRLRTAGPG